MPVRGCCGNPACNEKSNRGEIDRLGDSICFAYKRWLWKSSVHQIEYQTIFLRDTCSPTNNILYIVGTRDCRMMCRICEIEEINICKKLETINIQKLKKEKKNQNRANKSKFDRTEYKYQIVVDLIGNRNKINKYKMEYKILEKIYFILK